MEARVADVTSTHAGHRQRDESGLSLSATGQDTSPEAGTATLHSDARDPDTRAIRHVSWPELQP